MRKRFLVFCVCCLCLLSARAMARTYRWNTEEDMVQCFLDLWQEKPDVIEGRLSQKLFSLLTENDFRSLQWLEVKSGIENATVFYSESGSLRMEDIIWASERAWAECYSREEVESAMQVLTGQKKRAFHILCPPELARELVEGEDIYAWAARDGVENMQLYTRLDAGILYCMEMVYTDLPTWYVEDENGFWEQVRTAQSQQTSAFRVCFSDGVYQALLEDETRERLLFLSCLDQYACQMADSMRMMVFTQVTYTDAPHFLCASEEDLVEVIRAMGSRETASFAVQLTEADFTRLAAHSFQGLHERETEAGLVGGELSYDYMHYRLYYENARILTTLVRLEDTEALLDYMQAQAAQEDTEIILLCSEALYTYLLGGVSPDLSEKPGMLPIFDAAVLCGIYQFQYQYSHVTHLIQIHVSSYYPGAHILRCVQEDRRNDLDARETAALRVAENLAQQCRNKSEVETARRIHDSLCARIVYTDDETGDDDDTAIGALLLGEANCDGYADAFYLVGSLAGLTVRCQHGDSFAQGQTVKDGVQVTHMWNLLQLDGTWRLVDVTWDDMPSGAPADTFFNIGLDRASRTHVWNREMTVPLRETTDLAQRLYPEYEVFGQADMEAAVGKATAERAEAFGVFFLTPPSQVEADAALACLQRSIMREYSYLYNAQMGMLTVTDIRY